MQERSHVQEEDIVSHLPLITAEQPAELQTLEITDVRQENKELQEEVDKLTVMLIDARSEFEELTQSLLTQIEDPLNILAVAVDQPSTVTVNVSEDDGLAQQRFCRLAFWLVWLF